MANDLSHLINRPTRNLTATAIGELGTARPPHISRRGNNFTLVDAAGNSRPGGKMVDGAVSIDVIIIDANPHTSRMYFEGAFDENTAKPPLCWSDNGTGPSTQSTQPQSLTCAACPQAVWGSAVSKASGQGIPACNSFKKLAVLAVDDPHPIIYEFVVMAGSWSDKQHGWRRYVHSVSGVQIGQRQADLSDLVTRIFYVRTGVLGFKPLAMISAEQADMVDKAWASNQTGRIVGNDDKAIDPTKPLGSKPQAITTDKMAAPATAPLNIPPPPQPVTDAPKRVGRPPKPAATQTAPVAPVTDLPPFLTPRPLDVAAVQATAPLTNPPPAPAQHGMRAPEPMTEQMNAAIKQAFNLPT